MWQANLGLLSKFGKGGAMVSSAKLQRRLCASEPMDLHFNKKLKSLLVRVFILVLSKVVQDRRTLPGVAYAR